MNMKALSFVVVCGFILTGSLLNAESGKKGPEPTVCSISADPGQFNGKTVSISGLLESDGIERTVLIDSTCKKLGIAISSSGHFKGEAKLLNALRTGHPGTLDKEITGTFVGKFVWKSREVSPKRILVLKEVRNVSIVMK
jgi:hypothetical protein